MRRLKKCPACRAELKHDPDTEQLNECGECGADLAEAEAERDELAREMRIHRFAAAYQLGDVWTQKHVKAGTTGDALIAAATAERARREPMIDGRLEVGDDYDGPGAQLEAMAESIAARARGIEPAEIGRRHYGRSLIELAYDVLRPTGQVRALDPRRNGGRIAQLALHTTSDFPLLLGNFLNKTLQADYELAQPTYRLIAAKKTFNDFRPHRFLRRGDFPIPLQVNEHGEIQSGTMGESQELVSCLTFARIFGITRTAIVNDDLGALADLSAAAAQRVADFENSYFFTTCILAASGLGPTMSDSVAVYNSAHANLTGAGVLDLVRLGEGRAKMMSQTGIDGLKLNVQPRTILVSPTSLTLAEQLTTQITPATFGDANPFQSRLVAIGDANLGTSTRFYLLSDPARGGNYVWGHLDGFDGPRFEVKAGWEVEGAEAKIATDYGVGVTDWRFGVTGAGV